METVEICLDTSLTELTYTIYSVFETTPEDTSFYTRDTDGDTEITLSSDDWIDVEQPIEITGNSITLQISADIDDSCLVTDLNLVEGTIKKNWTQNSNESYTDNVQIGKGIKIKSTGTDTEFEATAGGILINNSNSNQPVSEFTKYGTKTDELIVKKDAQISESILIQKIGEQTWFSSL